MSLTYRIDASAGLIHISCRDRLLASEMQQMAEALLQDPDFRPGLHVLADQRELNVAPSTDDVRVAANLIQRVGEAGLGRIAIVATKAVIYGMSQMIGDMAEVRGQQVEVFNRVEDALAWLTEPESDRTNRAPRPNGPRRTPRV